MAIYPSAIVSPLIKGIHKFEKLNSWYKKSKCLPEEEIIQLIVDTIYHASFLTEEGRRPGFRVIYCAKEDIKSLQQKYPITNRNRTITFPSPRPFTVSELNRIAPAADLIRFLICICPTGKEQKALHIWGLLDTGENWWKFVHHETSGGQLPPNYLTITSTAPGELSFSLQGVIIMMLKGGVISYPTSNPIWKGPISNFLRLPQYELYSRTIRTLKTKKLDQDGAEDEYPRRYYNCFIERILYNVRNLRHGGTIVMVPDTIASDDPRLTDRIMFKYCVEYDYAWNLLHQSLVNYRHYYDLYFKLTRKGGRISKEDFNKFQILDHEKESISEDVQDIAKSIASLTGVDGAVVLTTHFKVLGFGGEITAVSPALTSVINASDRKQNIPVDAFGTRHRSAFRFCSSFEDSFAFIVSSDGGVKAVKREGRDLLFWPDINEGSLGL